MKCFHGTTQENFLNLIYNGDKPSGAWNCSDMDGNFYVYPENKIYGDDEEERISEGIQQALGNAAITAAFQMKTQNIVILELDIPEDELNDDYSCDNMSGVASFTEYFDLSWIKKVYITEFNAMFSPFCLPSLDNPNLNYIDESLELLAKSIQQSDSIQVFCDIMDILTGNIAERDLKSFF